MKFKQLEWEKVDHVKGMHLKRARVAGFQYDLWIKSWSPGYMVSLCCFGLEFVIYDGEDDLEAEEAAQNDFESRIKSLIIFYDETELQQT